MSHTAAATLNAQTGGFSVDTTGTDAYASGGATGSDAFGSSEFGNTFGGTVSLTQTGASRYTLLQQFNNTSDGANGGSGLADFSSVGLPIGVDRTSTTAGTFSSVGDAAYQYCFAAGTLVLMADGTPKAIEKIEPGEMVLAAPEHDPEAAPAACPVSEVYHNAPARLLEVTIASAMDPLHGEVIRTTAEHPFYVGGGRGWTHAKDLQAGDRLRTSDGGWSKVRSVAPTGDRPEPVFNLCVAIGHTYFVTFAEGRQAVLVHNSSSWGARGWGALKLIGGVAETAAGVVITAAGAATSELGVGVPVAVGGGVVTLHGGDTFMAGARQLWTGENTRTFTAQGITKVASAAGASPRTAEMIGDGGDAIIGIIGIVASGGTSGGSGASAVVQLAGGGQKVVAIASLSPELQAAAKGARALDAAYMAASGPGNPTPPSASPALPGSPYNPDAVEDRIKPPYEKNPAHIKGSASYNPEKGGEPSDAAEVYESAIRGDMKTWYGKNASGAIYRFFSDNAGHVHFSGSTADPKNPLPMDRVPIDVRRTLGATK